MSVLGTTIAATALAAAATLSPIESSEPAPSVAAAADALARQGSLVEKTAKDSSGHLRTDEAGSVTLGSRSASRISIELPGVAGVEGVATTSGVTVYRSREDPASVVVNPTETGVQVATVLASPDSPSRFTYRIDGPAGSSVVADDGGGARVVDRDGETLAVIDAPWARDADGVSVPTRFELDGSSLTQVVDHRVGTYTYPITADPKVFACDLYTAICVKFTKGETKSIAKSVAGKTATATALAICSKIPHAVIAVGCVAVVTPYALLMGKSFRSASKAGKCVELHFRAAIPYRWKTEKC